LCNSLKNVMPFLSHLISSWWDLLLTISVCTPSAVRKKTLNLSPAKPWPIFQLLRLLILRPLAFIWRNPRSDWLRPLAFIWRNLRSDWPFGNGITRVTKTRKLVIFLFCISFLMLQISSWSAFRLRSYGKFNTTKLAIFFYYYFFLIFFICFLMLHISWWSAFWLRSYVQSNTTRLAIICFSKN
jgi:hypothetical protein